MQSRILDVRVNLSKHEHKKQKHTIPSSKMAPKSTAPSSQHSFSSLEESSESIAHESVEGIPIKDEEIHLRAPTQEFNDEFSVLVRQGSKGIALYSVLILSVIISFVSFLLVILYEPPLQQEGEGDVNLWSNVCAPQSHKTVWADLLTEQIEILQNLIHASLLGAAVLVTAYRGDPVWLFFVRNCLFYFLLAAASFLMVDTPPDADMILLCRWIIALLFCFFGMIGFFKLEATCRSLRKLQMRLFDMRTQSSSMKETVDCDSQTFPKYQAQTSLEQRRANIIYQSAIVVQIIAVAYVVCTTAFALEPFACDDDPHRLLEGVMADKQHMPSTSLSPFQMGYSLGAHEAFLLALFMLASTFPKCPASVGGALLSSVWRLLIACCSLISLLSTTTTGDDMNIRTIMSLIFTLAEAASMVPIVIASLQLTVQAGTFQAILGRVVGQKRVLHTKSTASYAPVASIDIDDDHVDRECDEIETGRSGSDAEPVAGLERSSVPTLRIIASSPRFSTRQQFGARIMWISSLCLLVGMTLENMILLLTSPIGSHSTHETYKWGMHVCAMYAFCVVMNVASTKIYSQTRMLLFFACPVGSLIGLWQLWVLASNTLNLMEDPIALLVACLFLWRALSGTGQCIGLVVLEDIEPITETLERMDVTTNDAVANDESMLREAISQGRIALFRFFLPAFVAYTAASALLSSCSEPMISPTVPDLCRGMGEMFMLNPSWPGLGLFFHFGGLLAIFASDGLTTFTPSYPPSLLIGAIFAVHVSILIATHLAMELIHPNVIEYVGSFDWKDWLRRITLIAWMASSFYLYRCLIRVWRLKQPIN